MHNVYEYSSKISDKVNTPPEEAMNYQNLEVHMCSCPDNLLHSLPESWPLF